MCPPSIRPHADRANVKPGAGRRPRQYHVAMRAGGRRAGAGGAGVTMPAFEPLEPRALLAVSFTFDIVDDGSHATYYDRIRSHLLAAAEDWGRRIVSNAFDRGALFADDGPGVRPQLRVGVRAEQRAVQRRRGGRSPRAAHGRRPQRRGARHRGLLPGRLPRQRDVVRPRPAQPNRADGPEPRRRLQRLPPRAGPRAGLQRLEGRVRQRARRLGVAVGRAGRLRRAERVLHRPRRPRRLRPRRPRHLGGAQPHRQPRAAAGGGPGSRPDERRRLQPPRRGTPSRNSTLRS